MEWPGLDAFPSVITLASDRTISCHTVPHSDDYIQESNGILCNIASWTKDTWKLDHDALCDKSVSINRPIAGKSRINTAHLFSDCVMFLCGDTDSAVTMFLAWLNCCDHRLSEQPVKPAAHIVIIDHAAPKEDDFIRACSARPEAGELDDYGLRRGYFSAVCLSTCPSTALRIYNHIAMGTACIPWHKVKEAYFPSRRRRENLGRMWSRRNLSRLYQAWCEKSTGSTPEPIELLTARLPGMERQRQIQRQIQIQCQSQRQSQRQNQHHIWDRLNHVAVQSCRPETSDGKGLYSIIQERDTYEDIKSDAIPVMASVLAVHSTLSYHWSDKNCYMEEHFSLRYRPVLIDVLSCNPLIESNTDDYTQGQLGTSSMEARPSSLCSNLLRSAQRQWSRHIRAFVGCETRMDVVRIHLNNLQQHTRFLKNRICNTSCASCILQAWDTILPCSHGLCKLCLRAKSITTNEGNQLCLEDCPICRLAFPDPCFFPVEPPTAVGRVLALDGGGVKGIVQLEILRLLEEKIGLDIPFTSFFDLVVGTSIGGICALGLGKCGWSIQECKEKFLVLTKRVFSSLSAPEEYLTWVTKGWYKTVKSAFKVLLTDSIYDTELIETVLKDAFGSSSTMVSPRTHLREPRVAVVVDEASSSTCKILPTYNKAGHRREKQYNWPARYPDFLVWEAGRSTSAAPGYWRPKTLHGEDYQDGGLDWNNPTAIARQEAKVLYPQHTDKNVIVSVGCGKTKSLVLDNKSFLWRLWQNFSDKIDAEKQHEKMYLFVERGTLSLHRLNPSLELNEVRLNDWPSIPALQVAILDTMRKDHSFRHKLDETARVLLASLFYLELKASKRFDTRGFKVLQGVILSRLDSRELRGFKEKYKGARLEVGGSKFPVTIPLSIDIPTLSEQTPFQVRLVVGRWAQPISGSPFTIEQLRNAQRDFLPLVDMYTRKRKISNV